MGKLFEMDSSIASLFSINQAPFIILFLIYSLSTMYFVDKNDENATNAMKIIKKILNP